MNEGQDMVGVGNGYMYDDDGERYYGYGNTEYHGWKFHQSGGTSVPSNWILLDNKSTVDVFFNSQLLDNMGELNLGDFQLILDLLIVDFNSIHHYFILTVILLNRVKPLILSIITKVHDCRVPNFITC